MKRLVVLCLTGALTGLGCSATTTTTTPGTSGPAAASSSGSAPSGSAPATAAPRTTPPGTASRGGGSVPRDPDSTFCSRIQAADEITKTEAEPDAAAIDRFTGLLAEARDAGPAEAREPLDVMIDTYRRYKEVVGKPERQDEALDIFLNERSMGAGTQLDAIVRSECGIDLDISGGGAKGDDDGGSGSGSSGTGSGSDRRDGPTSLSVVKDAVKAKAGDAPWAKVLFGQSSWGRTSFNGTSEWRIQLLDTGSGAPTLNAADGVEACQAINDYLGPLEPGFTLVIKDAADRTIIEKTSTGSCTEV